MLAQGLKSGCGSKPQVPMSASYESVLITTYSNVPWLFISQVN